MDSGISERRPPQQSIPKEIRQIEERNLCDLVGRVARSAQQVWEQNKGIPVDTDEIRFEPADFDEQGRPYLTVKDKRGVLGLGNQDIFFLIDPDGSSCLLLGVGMDKRFQEQLQEARAMEPEEKIEAETMYAFMPNGTIEKRVHVPTIRRRGMVPSVIQSEQEYEIIGQALARMRDGLRAITAAPAAA